MRSKLFCAAILALFLPFAAKSASAQADYAAHEDRPRYIVGGGISGYSMDWGHGKMYGPTLWGDWNPPFMPGFLSGLGMELTARDISWHRSSSQPPDFRTDTIGGGLIYHHRVPFLSRIHSLQPYVKAQWYYGSIDHTLSRPSLTPVNPEVPQYNHETRTVTALGAGFDYHLVHHLAIRADYEYQFWPDFLGRSGRELNPAGITLGVMYGFGHTR